MLVIEILKKQLLQITDNISQPGYQENIDCFFAKPIGLWVYLYYKENRLSRVCFSPDPQTRRDRITQETTEKLVSYFKGDIPEFTIDEILFHYPDFTKKVLLETMKIPYGMTLSYNALAVRIGKPKCVRAVANAEGKNKTPIVIPCHRVIAKNGLGGYSPGIDIKKRLLDFEGKNIG